MSSKKRNKEVQPDPQQGDLTQLFTAVDNAGQLQVALESLAHQNAQNKILSAQIEANNKMRGSQRDLIDRVVTAVSAIEPYKKVNYVIGDGSATPVAAVINLSDLHIGEYIRAEETEGFGAFDWEIAQRRMNDYIDRVIDWVSMHRRYFKIHDLHIAGIGDYISGNIHTELLVTNEFPLPVQTAKAGMLIGHAISRLAPHFQKVQFIGVGADNHSRLQPKPQAKQKALNSMSYLVHTIAEAAVTRHDNVEFIRPEGMKYLAEIQNHRFLIEHGDTIKAVMGIPFYGFERHVGREAVRRMGTKTKEFDYVMLGHWHVPNIIGRVLVNGSLSGTTEYDHSAGRHALPSQVSFLVHPKHGFFDWTAWKMK